jgi:hypothetical protein
MMEGGSDVRSGGRWQGDAAGDAFLVAEGGVGWGLECFLDCGRAVSVGDLYFGWRGSSHPSC